MALHWGLNSRLISLLSLLANHPNQPICMHHICSCSCSCSHDILDMLCASLDLAGLVGSGILGGLGLAEVVGVLGVVVGVGWLAQ